MQARRTSHPHLSTPHVTLSTPAPVIGMSFWTDAAVLSEAGIPAILYGPTGAGLHSIEEWVDTQSVLTCRDALVVAGTRLVPLDAGGRRLNLAESNPRPSDR